MPSYQAYCSRCEKSFPYTTAKQQHIKDSSCHNVCHLCSSSDFETKDELDAHLEFKHFFCTSCNQEFDTASLLSQHDVGEHNMCHICRRYFQTSSNLKSHKITHSEKNVNCPGCSNRFTSNSAMILHLEAGTCECGAGLDEITEFAFECHRSEFYKSENTDFNFQCPSCQTPFRFMSGLLQHAESDYCDESLVGKWPLGIFLRFVKSRIH